MKKQLNPAPIGIDLGSYKSKIAVAKRGGVEIITTKLTLDKLHALSVSDRASEISVKLVSLK